MSFWFEEPMSDLSAPARWPGAAVHRSISMADWPERSHLHGRTVQNRFTPQLRSRKCSESARVIKLNVPSVAERMRDRRMIFPLPLISPRSTDCTPIALSGQAEVSEGQILCLVL